MATIRESLAIAVEHHRAGRLQAAEEIYRRILAVDPSCADALHLLGTVVYQMGKHELAVEYIGRAIELKGTKASFHYNLGNAFRDQGKLDEAIGSYRRALALQPDYAIAHNNLGNALKDQGNLDEAIASHHRALALMPDYAEAHYNLGNALRIQGKLDEAVACYRRALGLNPTLANAHNNLGIALQEKRQLDDAVACYRRALELKPDYGEAQSNLGVALQAQGKLDEAIACYRRVLHRKPNSAEAAVSLGSALQNHEELDEAIACYHRALKLKPDYHIARNNLGTILQEQGRLDEAIVCYRQTLQLKPDFAAAHYNLGAALQEQEQLDDAVACYRRALELRPDYNEAQYNLGTALREQGKMDEASDCFRRTLQQHANHLAAIGALVHGLQHLCRWEDQNSLSRCVIDAVAGDSGSRAAPPVSPFAFFALPIPTTAEQQLQCAYQWTVRQLKAGFRLAHKLTFNRPSARDSKTAITVGYLSADFHSHATARLIAEVLEQHDRGRFNVFGYSYGRDDDSPMRRRLVKAFDQFVDIKELPFPEAAERIAADGVDILIDLKGYTQHARTEILALRPAPIQVNYLGYPGTMGASFMDYILVDDFVVPMDQQPFYTEKLVHLPGCYQANDSQREISPKTPSRAESGLPEEGFVFCCFNNSYKITPEVFDVWMRLLKAIPGSVLWLLEGNRFAPPNLRKEAEARGIAAERLVFAQRRPLPEHLARHRLADLFLDTFPVNAHTTASDSLWAGCPLLTIAGETFVSRVAGSLLRAVGLPELITHSLDEYERLALRLSRDSDQLSHLRSRLASSRQTCGLFDAKRFARNIEEAYLAMWEIHRSGEPPRAFAVSPQQSTQPDGATVRARRKPSLRKTGYNIVLLQPPKYVHSSAFGDIARLLTHSFSSLGISCEFRENRLDPKAVNILLGYNLLKKSSPMPDVPYVVYQLEQLSDREGWLRPWHLELFRKAQAVWDYAPENIEYLRGKGVENVRLLPIGYHPSMQTIEPAPEDIDILFYGSLNDRRRKVLDELGRTCKVKRLFGMYAKDRDRYIARSRIVLNIHFYESQIMEQVRISHLLNNKRFVISEAAREDPYQGNVVTAPYHDLAECCRRFLNSPIEREAWVSKGVLWFSSRPMDDHLRDVLR